MDDKARNIKFNLIEARDYIADGWTNHSRALDAEGRRCYYGCKPEARYFSPTGAIEAAIGHEACFFTEEDNVAIQVIAGISRYELLKKADESRHASLYACSDIQLIELFNEQATHEEVVALFDYAISKFDWVDQVK